LSFSLLIVKFIYNESLSSKYEKKGGFFMDGDLVKNVLKDMIIVEEACSDYLRKIEEKQEPFKRIYSIYNTHDADINSFSELMFNKMKRLKKHDTKFIPFSMYHLLRYLDNHPDEDDPELLNIIQWVNTSYTDYIINLVSQNILKE
jgi:hypothetical protein